MRTLITSTILIATLAAPVGASDICDTLGEAMVQSYAASQRGVSMYQIKVILDDSLDNNLPREAKEAMHEMIESVYSLPPGVSSSRIRNAILENCDI